MRIQADQLPQLLPQNSAWRGLLVAGDEPYLVIEAQDFVRHFLRDQAGFLERDLFEVASGFDWNDFRESTQSLSLFSERKIVELRFQNRPDTVAQRHLLEYFENPSPDIFLLVCVPRLTNQQLKAKWADAFDKNGAVMPIYPPRPYEYPRWIGARARQKGLRLSDDAIDLLAVHNEGNLFSVMQELDYLALFYGNDPVSGEGLKEALTQSSRFITFDLGDALLTGDIERIFRIIDGLREEGEPATLVNWVLHKEIATLGMMKAELDNGAPMQEVLKRVWQNKRPLYQGALRRFSPKLWQHLAEMLVQIDEAIKGELKEDPWNAILRVSFALAGKRLLSLSATVTP